MARLAIRMPKMSMTMTEGEMGEWQVAVGDAVESGDVVCEVMTDKVDMEVESTVAGTLVEIVHQAGAVVAVGEPIGWVEGEDDGGGFGDLLAEPAQPAQIEPTEIEPDQTEPSQSEVATDPAAHEDTPVPTAAAPPAEPAAPQDAAAPDTRAPAEPGRPAAAIPAAVPRARGLAREHGIDLATVVGTGPDGLIRVRDVEANLTTAAAATPAATPAAVPTAATPAAATPAAAPTAATPAAATPAAAAPAAATSTRAAPSGRKAAIRAAVAKKMEPSALIPQFTVWREVQLEAANVARRGISWTTVLLRAYAAALREVPELLTRWEGQAVESGPPTIALAVATERGLMVPSFAEPDQADPVDLDEEIRAVVRAAHSGKLGPAYLGIANGSLSNLGGLGVDRFQALLTPPQASVLSLGSIRHRPVAVPGGVGVALTVEAGLTVDHRVADGAQAAELLQRFATLLSADG